MTKYCIFSSKGGARAVIPPTTRERLKKNKVFWTHGREKKEEGRVEEAAPVLCEIWKKKERKELKQRQ